MKGLLMSQYVQMFVTILTSIIASTGFWTFLYKVKKDHGKENAMLIGLGHDRIISLGMEYLKRGYIYEAEYDNLYNYLYVPYKRLGGNGSAERIIEEVKKLPIK